jgi:anti-sigma factor RsiW
MNDEPVTQDDPIREELVAYLDGELDAEASERVDQRLRTDAQYQKKLQELQRAWDLLDELPRAYVSDSFTQSTVEMVALSAAADLQQTQALQKRQKATGAIVVGACIVVAAGLGYAIMAQRLDDPNQRLVRDLPVIENVHLYSVAESTDFLRELEKSGLFNEDSSNVQ